MTKQMNNLTPLGKEIKKSLIDKGLTHTQLASEVGTTLEYLGHIMHGRKSGKKYIYKIADILEIDINKFKTNKGAASNE